MNRKERKEDQFGVIRGFIFVAMSLRAWRS
jgi:hypothetical protein